MTEQATIFAPTALEERHAELDTLERGDDPTPRELVRAVLAAAMPVIMAAVGEDPPGLGLDLDAVDVCAGYGVWASELRRWAARAHIETMITGVEICEARRKHIRKWCDAVDIGDWREQLRGSVFDVATGNPDFKLLLADHPDESMPAVLLRHVPAVLLFHQTASFQRGRIGVETWRRYPPARVWLVPGSVGFRGPRMATDSRCYQATLWLRDHAGPCELDMLPGPPDGRASWRWTVPPGSEEPSEDMPAAPGWTP